MISLPIGRDGDTEGNISLRVTGWSWYLSRAPARINWTLACYHGDEELRLGTAAHSCNPCQIVVVVKCSEKELQDYLLDMQSLTLLVEDAVRSRVWGKVEIPVAELSPRRQIVGTFPVLDADQRGIGCVDVEMAFSTNDCSLSSTKVDGVGIYVGSGTQGLHSSEFQIQSLLERLEIEGDPDPSDVEAAASIDAFELLVAALQRCERTQQQVYLHSNISAPG